MVSPTGSHAARTCLSRCQAVLGGSLARGRGSAAGAGGRGATERDRPAGLQFGDAVDDYRGPDSGAQTKKEKTTTSFPRPAGRHH